MLASTERLTLHFTAYELGADRPDIPAEAQANLYSVARWLEAARAVLGVALVVNHPGATHRGWRSRLDNVEAGGTSTSDHPNGLAADFTAEGLSPYTVYTRLRDAGAALPPFDELIYYALDDHVHVGLGPRMRGAVLFKTTEGGYVQLTSAWVAKLRGFV
jgi:zinc D-Ala-D-Ala carboxypeptidase